MSVKAKLMKEIAEPMATSGNKVTIVGIGQVGMACAFSILTQVSCRTYRVTAPSKVPQVNGKNPTFIAASCRACPARWL